MACKKCLKDMYPGKVICVLYGNCLHCQEPISLLTSVRLTKETCDVLSNKKDSDESIITKKPTSGIERN